MYRYKITFAYDGTNFSGFQIQPNKRTVEQTLKNAVNKIAKHPTPAISVIGSGRTDAGVHRKKSSKRSEFLRVYLYFCHVIQSFICFLNATLR